MRGVDRTVSAAQLLSATTCWCPDLKVRVTLLSSTAHWAEPRHCGHLGLGGYSPWSTLFSALQIFMIGRVELSAVRRGLAALPPCHSRYPAHDRER